MRGSSELLLLMGLAAFFAAGGGGGCGGSRPAAATNDLVVMAVAASAFHLVLANDRFAANGTVTSVTTPASGSAEIGADGKSVTYVAPADAAMDQYCYTASDGIRTGSACVDVVVQPPSPLEWCAFSPYVDGQDPRVGGTVSYARLVELLRLVRPYCNGIRTYGLSSDLVPLLGAAKRLGFEVALGAWLDSNLAANQVQIDRLKSQCLRADVCIVGNETLLRQELTAAQLVSYLNDVRGAAAGVPVTTADVPSALLANPSVLAASDVVYVNVHPWWGYVDVDGAISRLHEERQQLTASANGKPIAVAEAGWRSFGGRRGGAVASPENQLDYLVSLASYSRASGVDVIFFQAFDEPWKSGDDGWGLFSSGPTPTLKPGMTSRLFAGETAPDTWSRDVPVSGAGTPALAFVDVPPWGAPWNDTWITSRAQHVVPQDHYTAVYIFVQFWGWVVKPTLDSPRSWMSGAGTAATNVATGGNDHLAQYYAAFVLPETYDTPAINGGSLPTVELCGHALASTFIERSYPDVPLPLCE